MNCNIDELTLVCAHCGRKAFSRETKRNCLPARSGTRFGDQKPSNCLAGTALKTLLASIGITSTPNCSCNARAREMDARGPDWCEENIDTIVGWLREEATKRNLPFLDAAAKLLVKRAIHNARKAAQKDKLD